MSSASTVHDLAVETSDFSVSERNSIEGRSVEIGEELYSQVHRERPWIFQRRWWDDRLMDWSMSDEELKVQLFRFVDVADVDQRPSHLGSPGEIPWSGEVGDARLGETGSSGNGKHLGAAIDIGKSCSRGRNRFCTSLHCRQRHPRGDPDGTTSAAIPSRIYPRHFGRSRNQSAGSGSVFSGLH